MSASFFDLMRTIVQDVDDLDAWAKQIDVDLVEEHCRVAVAVAVSDSDTITRVKALSMFQALRQRASLRLEFIEEVVSRLIQEVSRTTDTEVEYSCARVLVSLLVAETGIREELLRAAGDAVRALVDTTQDKRARTFYQSVLSRSAPLGRRLIDAGGAS